MNEKLIEQIEKKYEALGEKPETYLQGLLQASPMTYWDYVGLETLLSLQRPRTPFKDEAIFIMYHQVTELVLKMMLHEIRQVVEEPRPSDDFLITKLSRMSRYTSMLITSFSVMREGMSYDDYNTFRVSLAPASGFQSVQFRFIELHCTRFENLLHEEGREALKNGLSMEENFDHLYWKDAGLNRKTGKRTLTLRQFEEKYQDELIALAKKMQGNTIEEKVNRMQQLSPALVTKLKEFDRLYNIEWPMVHLGTAQHYLDSKGENKTATGGSEWKKYLHPAFQQRRFFPSLWTEKELKGWGNQPG